MKKILAYSSLSAKFSNDVISLAKKNIDRGSEWDLNFIPPFLDEQRIENFVKQIKSNKLNLRYHLPYSYLEVGHCSKDISEYSVLSILHCLNFISALGGQFAVLHLGYHECSNLKDSMNGLKRIAKHAENLNIKICVENLVMGLTTSVANIKKFLEVDNVFLCLDTGHANVINNINKNYINDLVQLLDKVKHSHVYFSEDKSYNHFPFKRDTLMDSILLNELINSECDWLTMELDNFEEQEKQIQLITKHYILERK